MDTDQLYSFFLENPFISTDTRKIYKNSIFFSLKGANFNGNTFAKEAIKLGARIALVDEIDFQDQSNNIYYVENALQALQNLAKKHRASLTIPIIGLTGSNGKTTSKELIASVLKEKYNVWYTQGNLNNHIGVPLTILSIKPEHEIAIIEMGANHQKEIEMLSSICMPDIGYITNFGKAHLEGFGGIDGVIKGKSELYEYLKENKKTVLINRSDSLQIKQAANINSKLTFGETNQANYLITQSTDSLNFLCVVCNEIEIKSNLTGNFNFSNVSVAIALGLHFSIPIMHIKKGIESYVPTNLRSQFIKKGDKNILLDTYNANPSSVEVSLQNFAGFKADKMVILGDMFELGEYEAIEHEKIALLATTLNFDLILLVGERFYNTTILGANIKKFQTKPNLINFLTHTNTPTTVLIKGSRGMSLETIVDYL
ncbi:MAG: UDP-N-acetylmuramoyl-tripeptide--D-alanyl-D-alanine ligase [Solirubrobacteraceae bacterium]